MLTDFVEAVQLCLAQSMSSSLTGYSQSIPCGHCQAGWPDSLIAGCIPDQNGFHLSGCPASDLYKSRKAVILSTISGFQKIIF